MGTVKVRLLCKAQIHGAIQEPGYVFMWDEDKLRDLPHRTVRHSPELHQTSIDAVSKEAFTGKWAGEVEDEPLFVVIDDGKPLVKPADAKPPVAAPVMTQAQAPRPLGLPPASIPAK